MKKLATAALIGLSGIAAAQDFGGFDQKKMEALARQAQEAQACMAKIDEAELKRVQAAGEAKAEEVRALCSAGKRAEAQEAAVAYGKQVVEEPVVKQMQACAGLMDLSIPQAAWAQLEDSDTTKAHVCDL